MLCISSIHWSFDCFLCRFSTNGVYVVFSVPVVNIGTYVLTHLRRGGGGANICGCS